MIVYLHVYLKSIKFLVENIKEHFESQVMQGFLRYGRIKK